MTKETIRTLFGKYENIRNPIVSQLISSIPESFSTAIDKTISLTSKNTIISNNILKNRSELAKFVTQYHTHSDSITLKIQNNIKLLNEPRTQILASIHQPNLFPYGGVFKKIVLLEALKNIIEKYNVGKKFINLYIIVDHDFIDEIWVRIAQLPSIHHSLGILSLRMPVDKTTKWLMIKNHPLPSRVTLENWKGEIISWIKKLSTYPTSEITDKSAALNNFEEFWREVEYSYSKAKSYSDFNSFLMSSIVNKIWNYGTLFVRLSDISSVFGDGFKYLILNHEKYSETLRNTESIFKLNNINTGVSPSIYSYSPLWVHCQCRSKAPTKIHKNQNQRISLEGTCKSCHKDLHLHVENNNNDIDLPEEVLQNLSPRAIPILLLLSRCLGITCYASGTAGMNYIIFGSTLFHKLSVNLPLILIWPSRDIYHGIGQSQALKSIGLKDSNINSHIILLKQKNIEYEARIRSLLKEQQQHRPDVNIQQAKQLSEFHYVKEEQRKIRNLIKVTEKVKNALDLRPCFIDYAVNFGIRNIEIQWYNNLLKINNLAPPLILDL